MTLSFVKMLENFQKRMEVDAIEEFRAHLNASVNRSKKQIENKYSDIKLSQFENEYDMESYKGMLEDEIFMLEEVKNLADELSITALYKHIELHTKRVVKRHLPSIDESSISDIRRLKIALPFKLEKVYEYSSFNELRLINNSIKHQGKVSNQLASAFPNWVKGEKLSDLSNVYDRILPGIKMYVSSLVSNIASHTEI
jgi:hypothetical protein